jgi:hypothetical protein
MIARQNGSETNMSMKSILTASVAALAIAAGTLAWTGDAFAKGGGGGGGGGHGHSGPSMSYSGNKSFQSNNHSGSYKEQGHRKHRGDGGGDDDVDDDGGCYFSQYSQLVCDSDDDDDDDED